MRNSIRRLALVLTVAFPAMMILTFDTGSSWARSPRAGYIGELGEIVAADPGEDPHMRVDDPGADPVPVEDDSRAILSTGGRIPSPSDRTAGSGNLPAYSRVKTKLLLVFRLAFGAFDY